MEQSQNLSQNHQISVDEAKAWRKEAESLDRSQNHLNKIDNVLNKSQTENANITLENRDYQAMQKDRSDFRELQQQSQQQDQKIYPTTGLEIEARGNMELEQAKRDREHQAMAQWKPENGTLQHDQQERREKLENQEKSINQSENSNKSNQQNQNNTQSFADNYQKSSGMKI